MRHRNVITIIVGILFVIPAMAQYQFESKKAKKLYDELEVFYEEYDYEGILDREEDILSYWDAKQDTVTATMYSFLGEAYYYGAGETQKGLEYYKKELELRKSFPPGAQDNSEMLNLVFMYATLNDEVQNFAVAEEAYLDLLEKDKDAEGKKSEDYINTVLRLADHYVTTGEVKKGRDLLRKNRRSIPKNTRFEALSLKALGEYAEISGEFSKAEDNYKKSLVILEETGNYPSLEYIYVMNALGLLYTNKSQYPAAEEIYNQSLSILDRLGGENEESIAGINFNLGQVYKELGFFDDALELYLQILESDKEYYGDESFYVATTSFVIGDLYYSSKEYSKSEEYLLSAKSIFESIGEEGSLEYARTLNNLVRLYTATDRFEEAEQFANQTLTTYSEILGDDHWEYALSLSNVSDVYHRSGNLDQAEKYLTEADAIRRRKLGVNHPQYAKGTRKLAILNWKKENLAEALDYYSKTFDNYFSQINTYFPVLSEEEKSKFYYNQLRPTFEQFNSFIVENRSEDKELIELMYNYQLATKGLILYATSKVRESILNSGDSILINKYDTWISQKEQLAQLFSESSLTAEERNQKIDSLAKAANDLEGELSDQSAVFAQNFANRDLTWKDVKAKLKPGEAAIEVIRFRDFDPDSAGVYTDEVYYAALIVKSDTEDAPEIVIMRNGAQMEKKYLSNYRNAIKYQVNENFSYRLFWRPIANRLRGIKKVYFSPDGVYNQISIYTLQNPSSKKFTIDEFEIKLVTNTKDLVAFNYDDASNSSNPSFLFGYPNYNMGVIENRPDDNDEDRSIQRGTTTSSSRGVRGEESTSTVDLTRGGLPRGIRGNLLRYMRSNSLLGLLPGTQVEVNLIDSLYGNTEYETMVYMENEAVEEKIKEAKSPQTLHIATHGFFLEAEEGDDSGADKYVSNPLLRSGLILAGANSYISTGQIGDESLKDDGILTAYEAMNLNLDDTELVVLSACETGLGEIQNGEGVFGLQRAFQIAGAEAIIMSMWSVDDAATQELMTNFYEEWLKSGDKNQAFVKAQKRLKDKWKYPYYWGAFVMVGN